MYRQEYTSVIVRRGDGSTPEQYLKWISYLPKHWRIEEILNKPISALNESEIRILKRVKSENEVKPYFENIVSTDKTKPVSAYFAYLYMDSISIHQYAKIKLTQQELDACHSQVLSLGGDLLKEKIADLSLKQTNSMIDDYLLFLLKEKKRGIELRRLNKEIKSQIAANEAMHERGIQQASNPHRRCKRI